MIFLHGSMSSLQVLCGAEAAELAEIMDEMSLVVVAAPEGELRQVRRVAAAGTAHRALEPPYSAEELRCHSHVSGEDFDEAPLLLIE